MVAHPPCARWSRLAGFTEARFGYRRGDDAGCFAAALAAVRRWGGVLEHPAYSKAFDAYGLAEPLWRGGWTLGLDGGASCYVEQGRYGLPAKKATWLYAYGVELAELRWGFTPDHEGERPRGPWGGIDGWRDSWTSKSGWRVGKGTGWNSSAGGSAGTPPAFRDALLAMAYSRDPISRNRLWRPGQVVATIALVGFRRWLTASDESSSTALPAQRRPSAAIPRAGAVVRTGTALEVAELAWIGEGVTRETALSIPSVAACRNLIVGTVVQLSLYKYRGGDRLDADYLTSKPDPSTGLQATMGGTVDDLVFHGRAFWRVLDGTRTGSFVTPVGPRFRTSPRNQNRRAGPILS